MLLVYKIIVTSVIVHEKSFKGTYICLFGAVRDIGRNILNRSITIGALYLRSE